jgi:hypothetical protein
MARKSPKVPTGAEVKGLDKIKAAIKNNEQWIAESLGRALFDEAWAIMRKSQRLVPVDKNFLRNSKVVLPPQFIGKKIQVAMGYGMNYAIYVHERVYSVAGGSSRSGGIVIGTFVKHEPPTQAKYLEVPLEKAREGYVDRINQRTYNIWRRKTGRVK